MFTWWRENVHRSHSFVVFFKIREQLVTKPFDFLLLRFKIMFVLHGKFAFGLDKQVLEEVFGILS